MANKLRKENLLAIFDDTWENIYIKNTVPWKITEQAYKQIKNLIQQSGEKPEIDDSLLEFVSRQIEDDGLWFEAQTAPEAYLQQELRKLHQFIEDGAKRDKIRGDKK